MTYDILFADLAAAKHTSKSVPSTIFGLSEEQSQALSSPFSRSAVICAGAGAGKTRLLVERVSALIKAGVNPRRIAVVTFTRKAAAEITSRVALRLGDKTKQPVCGTVHALALSVLTRRKESFLLASEAQEHACLSALSELLPDEFEGLSSPELLLLLNRAREQDEYHSLAGLLALAYEEQLSRQGLEDFTSLLARAALRPDDRFDYVLVDEAQDLSNLQLKFLRSIGTSACFWFIGDPDQAIYSFRGAQASMMHVLQEACDDLHVLSINYRCARSIVTHANNVIQFNTERFPVSWKAERHSEGAVTVHPYQNAEEELDAAIKWASSAPPKRCVLGRTQAIIAPLKALGLPAMSVHESKGLEWEEVLVMGCEAALFPHPLAAREEERRLFYVAMTRARDSLSMSYCATRSSKNPQMRTRHPSVFLFEAQALQAKS